jgi:histidinol-phosphate/aromatic aminotransferase/cobyric acid decarboxylase-like protein
MRIDACTPTNPYATQVLTERFLTLGPDRLAGLVAHRPSPAPALAELVGPYVGVPADHVVVATSACAAIQSLLAGPGKVLLSLPTCTAYHELARGPVVVNELRAERNFRLDLDALERKVDEFQPTTVVIVTPNSPNGAQVDPAELICFLERVKHRVPQVIVDETYAHFASADPPFTLAHRVDDLPHLIVVNNLGASHGMAGLGLGFAVTSAARARTMRDRTARHVNAFAEWFCRLLDDADYTFAYESARRTYVRHTREFQSALRTLPGVKVYPSAANFSLLSMYRPASHIAAELLAIHGVYTRDCADKWGLRNTRFLRVCARTYHENGEILQALRAVLETPLAVAA